MVALMAMKNSIPLRATRFDVNQAVTLDRLIGAVDPDQSPPA
jgi:hypothetical protein